MLRKDERREMSRKIWGAPFEIFAHSDVNDRGILYLIVIYINLIKDIEYYVIILLRKEELEKFLTRDI